MSKKKVAEVKPSKRLKDTDQDIATLVSLGFTPAQVQAFIDVVNGDKPPSEMVSVGFWSYFAEECVDFDKLTRDDLVRAGISSAAAEFLIP